MAALPIVVLHYEPRENAKGRAVQGRRMHLAPSVGHLNGRPVREEDSRNEAPSPYAKHLSC